MAFTDEQLERYSRHIILKEVGIKGQKQIMNGRVLIIGAGGLGAPAAMYLAAAGVGTIGIADADTVDLSNLQRQIIHATADVGKPKVQSARETMNAMNPDVEVVTYHEWINSSNIKDIINDKDYDFIIDGTDNFPIKFLINDACVMLQKPFSHAGIIRFQGQLLTYIPEGNLRSQTLARRSVPGKGPCYRCIFKEPPPADAVPTCSQAGVLGVMGGVIGTLQASEALKYFLGMDLLNGYLLTYNALTMEFRKVALASNSNCPVCGKEPTITTLIDYEQAVCDLREYHNK
jgi:molybdopterin/thiamine biosynthesis adenylyltransferase